MGGEAGRDKVLGKLQAPGAPFILCLQYIHDKLISYSKEHSGHRGGKGRGKAVIWYGVLHQVRPS